MEPSVGEDEAVILFEKDNEGGGQKGGHSDSSLVTLPKGRR